MKCATVGKYVINATSLLHIRIHVHGSMTFLVDAEDVMRTKEDFTSRRQPKHHVGDAPSEKLRTDMSSCFPID